MSNGQLEEVDLIYVGCLIAYDGTDYSGFQYQNNAVTVQGCLEKALSDLTGGRSCRIVGSGRTDAGVHARGQIISAKIPWRHDTVSLHRAWNVRLPKSIVIRKLRIAPKDFHPRFSATKRTYRYYVLWEPQAEQTSLLKNLPTADRFALYETNDLNIELMNEAAAALVGTHDFATFGRSPRDMSSIRTIFEAKWHLVESNLPPLNDFGKSLVFTITANGFLRQMVRNLVASLMEVGRERWSVTDFHSALNAKERIRSAPLVPSAGLVLEKVDYPEHLDLFR